MTSPLDWSSLGPDWPNHQHSRFIQAPALDWHVQVAGQGDDMLLLHGTGASSHTWRHLLAELATQSRVIAPDLPGQGFSRTAEARLMSLPGMARAIGHLLGMLEASPQVVVAHSAGAAIALQMVMEQILLPRVLVFVAPALLPFGGRASRLFMPMTRLLAGSRLTSYLFSELASDTRIVRSLLRRTGSRLDEEGVGLYRTLIRDERHVANTLSMMAQWDLRPLTALLGRIKVPIQLVCGDRDLLIPAAYTRETIKQLKLSQACVHWIHGAGHLVHEEQPGKVVDLVRASLDLPREPQRPFERTALSPGSPGFDGPRCLAGAGARE